MVLFLKLYLSIAAFDASAPNANSFLGFISPLNKYAENTTILTSSVWGGNAGGERNRGRAHTVVILFPFIIWAMEKTSLSPSYFFTMLQ